MWPRSLDRNFTRSASEPPTDGSEPPPASTAAVALPSAYTFPALSTPMARGPSFAVGEPILVAATYAPAFVSLATTMSVRDIGDVNVPEPPRVPPLKLMLLNSDPVTTTLPFASTAMSVPESLASFGKFFDQTWLPLASSFRMYRSRSDVNGTRSVVPPMLIEPMKYPVTKTLPSASTATALALSFAVPPNRFDHWCAPVAASSLATTKSTPPAEVSEPPPKFTVPLSDDVRMTEPWP